MAIACFFLASKVEECVVKLKDIIHAYYSLKKLNPSEAVSVNICPLVSLIIYNNYIKLQSNLFIDLNYITIFLNYFHFITPKIINHRKFENLTRIS